MCSPFSEDRPRKHPLRGRRGRGAGAHHHPVGHLGPLEHGHGEHDERHRGERDDREVGQAEVDHEDAEGPQVGVGPGGLSGGDGTLHFLSVVRSVVRSVGRWFGRRGSWRNPPRGGFIFLTPFRNFFYGLGVNV